MACDGVNANGKSCLYWRARQTPLNALSPCQPMRLMKHLLSLLLVVLLGFTADAAEKSVRDTDYKQDGIWKPIAAVLGGVRLPKEAIQGIKVEIAGSNYVVTVEGEKEPDKGTHTLDTTTKPKRMTIKSTSGPNKGKTFLAIYEMKDANSMRVCYDLSGKDFPKEFKAPKGTELYLVGYRRQTKW